MANPAKFPGDINVPGTIYARGSPPISPPLARTYLEQDNNQVYPIPWTWWRVWNAFHTNLPGTSAADDLGLYGGTFGTDSPSIRTYDLKAAGATNLYARASIPLPMEYVAGETLVLRFHAGMLTTVADATATLDVVAYKSDREAGIGADLCATGAQSINNLTLADKDFTITPTTLEPGDLLDVRMHLAINDAATGTAVIGIVGAIERVCDIKG